MAPDTTVTGLLTGLTTSLESAISSIPEASTILPPQDGISLLDVKTNLFLSYLQNLAFLILLKLKAVSDSTESSKSQNVADDVVQKLVEFRVYLEKGVRPLEGRLKYEIDRILRAADTASRQTTQSKTKTKPVNGDGSDSEGSNDDDDEDEIDETSYRPNPAAFGSAGKPASENITRPSTSTSSGIYRPPRINPTALPTTLSSETPRAQRQKPTRSSAVDDFIATELSTAPSLEPSIGSTIVAGGRGTKTARDRVAEAERTAYEENNFVRLPALSKKEMARQRGRRDGQYGGEEMSGLGGDLDRIERATGGKRKMGGKLENGGKDGPRGDGFGGVVNVKRRKVAARKR